MNKNNQILIGIIVGAVIISISIYFSDTSNNQLSHSELFRLNTDCKNLANEFIEKNSTELNEYGNTISWEVKHTIYSPEQKTCFGEFDRFVYQNDTKRNFEEYYIYDLLKNIEIVGYTHSDSNSTLDTGAKFDSAYFDEYFNKRKEIFGLNAIDE